MGFSHVMFTVLVFFLKCIHIFDLLLSRDGQGMHVLSVTLHTHQLYRYVDAVTGRRSDTAHNYIYHHTDSEHSGLTVRERRRVVRVIFEYAMSVLNTRRQHILFRRNFRAVGVEHVSDTCCRNDSVQRPESSISYASRLIVISAGAFGSPAILERYPSLFCL